MKFLTHRISAESTGDFSQNIAFPPLLAAILNFCVKRKSVFILETVQDRSILMKFLTHRVSAESTGYISQKFLAAILNFCIKCKYAFILGTRFWQPS